MNCWAAKFTLLFAVSLAAAPPKSDLARRLEQAQQLRDDGDFRGAQQVFRSLLPQMRDAGDDARLGLTLQGLSSVEAALGEYIQAADSARGAERAFERAADRTGRMRAVNSLAVAQLHLGDYEAAYENFLRALALARSVEDREWEVVILYNVGNVHFFQGRYLDALRAYQNALERAEKSAGETWARRRRLIAVNNLATLFQRIGQNESALQLYQRVLRSSYALKPSEEGQMLTNLGTLYRSLGDPVAALATYGQAQERFAREQHHDGQMSVMKCIGIAQVQEFRNYPAALRAFSDVLKLAEAASNRREAMRARLYRGEVYFLTGRTEAAREEWGWVLAQAARAESTDEQWRALYGLGRIAALQDRDHDARRYFERAIEVIDSLRSRLQLTALKTEFLADKREVYDGLIALLLKNGDRRDLPEIFQLIERARARTFLDQLSDRLDGRYGPEQRRVAGQMRELKAKMAVIWARQIKAEAAEAQALHAQASRLENEYLGLERRLRESLPAAQLAAAERGVSLADVQARLDDSTAALIYWVGGTGGAALWVTRSQAGVVRQPDPAEDVRGLIASLDEKAGHSQDWRAVAGRLGRTLLAGIEPLGDARIHRLVIVPDGILGFIPFETLPLPRNSRELLVEAFDVAYLPSASLFPSAASGTGFRWAAPWRRQLVAFGDPRITPGGQALPGDERWFALPRSGDEVRSIARFVTGRAVVHTGSDALKSRLVSGESRGVPLLHLSTHAAMDAEIPERSRILFSNGGDEGSGYLFLGEIYHLDLSGVDLVTVSACETERGKMIRGEGVQSFSRAFLAAGARATITTLWRVPDEPTAEFMRQFYYALGEGRTKAGALRYAKLKFLHSGSSLAHPYYWAAFVLNGDGLSATPAPLSWTATLLAAAALLLAAAVVFARVGRP